MWLRVSRASGPKYAGTRPATGAGPTHMHTLFGTTSGNTSEGETASSETFQANQSRARPVAASIIFFIWLLAICPDADLFACGPLLAADLRVGVFWDLDHGSGIHTQVEFPVCKLFLVSIEDGQCPRLE